MKKIPHMEMVLAPLAVLAFAGLLSLMYGWVGDMKPPGMTFKENTPLKVIAAVQPTPPTPCFVGMRVAVPDAAVAQPLGLAPGSGAVVTEVVPGSPAEAAGLQPGDILLKCDHQPVNSPAGLQGILSPHRPGDRVKCLVLGENQRKRTAYIRLGQNTRGLAVAAQAPGAGPGTGPAGIVGVLSSGNTLYDPVTDSTHARYVMLMDPAGNQYAAVALNPGNAASGGGIPDLLFGANAGAVITSGLDPGTQARLGGIRAYTGVSGSVIDAYQLYRAGRLVPAG